MIVVDTSALMAVLLREPEMDAFADVLTRESVVIGAPTLVEFTVAARRRGFMQSTIDAVLAGFGIRCVPFGEAEAHVAARAFERFGRGRHPARLNFGDCLAYATASLSGPLLFKGSDFTRTDVPRA